MAKFEAKTLFLEGEIYWAFITRRNTKYAKGDSPGRFECKLGNMTEESLQLCKENNFNILDPKGSVDCVHVILTEDKTPPKLIDSTKNPITDPNFYIGNGSRVKIRVRTGSPGNVDYDKGYIKVVQILELEEGDSSYGFDEVEGGYVAPEAPVGGGDDTSAPTDMEPAEEEEYSVGEDGKDE